MDVLGDLVARDRRSDRPALRVDPADRELSYREFVTTAYKAGNFLRYLGTREGDRVAVAADRQPEPVLTFFGAALLGAATRFGPTGDGNGEGDGDSNGEGNGDGPSARAIAVPADRRDGVDLPAGSTLVVYGGEPAEPSVEHWEGGVWSENPAFPPVTVDPDAPALAADEREYDHAALLAAADAAAEALDLAADVAVAVRAPLSDPRAVAAGVLAPLLSGGAVVFPDERTAADAAVGDAGPEPRRLRLAEVRLPV